MAISFHPVKSEHQRIVKRTVKTGETIAVGDPVGIDSNGLIVCGTAALTALAGVAAEACTSAAAGTKIHMYDDPKQIYRVKCDNYAQAVQAEVGDTCDLVGSTGAFYANLDATSTNVLRVVQLGSEVDPLLAAAANDFFSYSTGNVVYVEIALHAFAS